jgi:hypothetical protein
VETQLDCEPFAAGRALEKWDDWDYLAGAVGDAMVTVDVTPTGLGDAVVDVEGRQVSRRARQSLGYW